MERIKNLFIAAIVLVTTFGINITYADEIPVNVLITPQNVSFEYCTQNFNLTPEKLFYLSLASINANNFETIEIQSKTGYILFRATNKEFLASIIRLGAQKSMLKITPTDGIYYFAPGIVTNIFKYINLNIEAPLTQIKSTK